MNKTIKVAGISLILASAPLLTFLKIWEGRPQVVYADKVAGGIPTVCLGITKHVTDWPIIVGDYWSDLKCEQIEQLVIAKTQTHLASCIKYPIRQETFDAVSSMSHNAGVGGVCASRALGLINAGKIAEGCYAISQSPSGKPVWSYVTQPDGSQKFIQGLYNRRLAETQMCLKGVNPTVDTKPSVITKETVKPLSFWQKIIHWWKVL